jgi:ribose transport system substrate-binding protein
MNAPYRFLAVLVMLAVILSACAGAPTEEATAEPMATVAPPEPSAEPSVGPTCEDVLYITSVRNLSNEYFAVWVKGAEEWVSRNGISPERHKVISDEGDTQVQVTNIQQLVSESGGCVAVNVTPTSSTAAESIVEAVQDVGGCVVTHWNKPGDLTPFGFTPNWVSHISYNGVSAGYEISLALFEAMGGKGNVVAIQGILDTSAAQERYVGFEKALAENPSITLLAEQPGDFLRQNAQGIMETWLAQYGDEIDGVWTANDDMALGVLEALRAAGLEGQIPIVGVDAVSEAVEAISKGEMTATSLADSYWQGGAGLEICAQYFRGVIDPATMPSEYRSFYAKQTIVDSTNFEQYIKGPIAQNYDWTRVFENVESQLDPAP